MANLVKTVFGEMGNKLCECLFILAVRLFSSINRVELLYWVIIVNVSLFKCLVARTNLTFKL